ncbi:S-adenosyl-L-methionine-dependent methyltransferase [Lasiosphaeris hirsuta]|uniref:S-adenosyl-L-methionine-dependent methyltransferase n=1 Tax=Lasiosphaeris hirsuta TaxID=260670 RepID=A0AA40DZB7_9PEZI|nr:S-adenosyl-L-methionine-dependent methyltransferase [Lasiosphaeris hirsuta]
MATPTNSYTLPSHLEGDGTRLDLQHEVFRLLLNNNLLSTPTPASFSGQVLDLGTGTGLWAAEFAAEHPHATVLGIDLFPPSTTPVPANCAFRALDAEKDADWDLPDAAFDLIHTRMFLFLLRDPRAMLRRCLAALRPGGRIECQEIQQPYRTEDGPEGEDTPVLRMARLRVEAARRCGLDRAVTGRLAGLVEEVGFGEVQVEEKRIPVGPWMEGERMKEAGEKYRQCMRLGMVAFTKTVFMKGLGWTEEQVLEACDEAVRDLGNGRVYAPIKIVVATKPASSSLPAASADSPLV